MALDDTADMEETQREKTEHFPQKTPSRQKGLLTAWGAAFP
jgi:hypothetical protein